MAFIVETTWAGRKPHTWITCVSRSMESAEKFISSQSDPKATHDLKEVKAEFPLYFVDIPTAYRHVSLADLKGLLETETLGNSDEIFFNIHRFSGEYRWGPPPRDITASDHIHILNKDLLEFRAGRGDVHAMLVFVS